MLACTHFPFLKAALRRVTDLPLVDPSAAVARQVARVLPPSVRAARRKSHFTSGDPVMFQAMMERLIGVEADVLQPSD